MVTINGRQVQRRTASIFTRHLTLNEAKHNPLWLGWDDNQIE